MSAPSMKSLSDSPSHNQIVDHGVDRSTHSDLEHSQHTLGEKPFGLASTPATQDGHNPQWTTPDSKVERIVEVISQQIHKSPDDKFESVGRKALVGLVSRYVEKNERILLIFPGFPFKSPSRRKVLGLLPDFGEELLLRKLNALARSIEDYHAPGARVCIVSDGIAYGEILGQPDTVVYRYNRELRRMCDEFSFDNIAFVRVMDLLTDAPFSDARMTEDEYVETVSAVRAQFNQHVVPGFDLETKLKEDVGTLRTYQGYLKFLIYDLEGKQQESGDTLLLEAEGAKEREIIAKNMLRNGAIFAHLIELRFPNCIRLSVHPHDNAGPKYAFQMPGGEMSRTPWHNVVKEEVDGSLSIAPLYTFDSDTFDIVDRYGRPYYLRAKAEGK